MTAPGDAPGGVLSLRGATMRFGERTLWQDVDLDLARGEVVAVLGANGSGKSTLLRAVLGLQPLSAGTVRVLGAPPHRVRRRIGLVPQQRLADDGLPLRGRDLVGLGVDGHRWGLPLTGRARRARVDALLETVGAARYAEAPVATLSGGEQQRLRIAQALAGDPDLLLCDEPLLSLDLTHQAMVARLVGDARRRLDLGVLFVTHDVNPILGIVDRVLYIAGERFRIGTPDEVLRSEVLSELYGTQVDVLRHRGRVLVAGVPDHLHHDEDADLAPLAADDHRAGAR